MGFLLDFFGDLICFVMDYFVIYNRNGSDFAKGLLYHILGFLSVVAAVLFWKWDLYILSGIFVAAGIVVFVLDCRHTSACIKERRQDREAEDCEGISNE